MRRVKSRDTTPEVLLRKALWAAGLRFRTCAENLPGKPDIVIRAERLAIFIDGDFWHGGQWRRRRLVSLDDQFRQTESRDYWLRKIRRNMDRDCRATAALLDSGWRVIRLWESEVLADAGRCVGKIVNSQPAGALSIAPRKTFAGIGPMGCALEKHGWTAAGANDALTLATASLSRGDLKLPKRMAARRPPLILLETAAGLVTSGGAADFEQALLALNRHGYAVDAFILDKRLFVLGRLASAAESWESQKSDVRPQRLVDFITDHPRIRWGIRELPAQPRSKPRQMEWIAESYLNPVVNELIHGHVLSPL
jgi:DNA mismatch endonuclease (patch repair protein)